MNDYDLVVIGTSSADVIFKNLPDLPKLGEEIWAEGIEVAVGGAANTTAALSRLGKRTCLISPVGNDFWGRFIVSELKAEGVDTQHFYYFNRPYANVTVAMNTRGDRTFVSYADKSDEDLIYQHQVDLIHRLQAKIFQINSVPGTNILPLLELIKKKNPRQMISLDTGWDPEWLTSDEFMRQLKMIDIYSPNEMEAMKITGSATAEGALDILAEFIPIVIVKLGAEGAICKVNGKVYYSKAPKVDVVDSTGAGDCFLAGFLYGWLDNVGIEESLRIGNICGSECVTKLGGYAGVPNHKQLELLMSR